MDKKNPQEILQDIRKQFAGQVAVKCASSNISLDQSYFNLSDVKEEDIVYGTLSNDTILVRKARNLVTGEIGCCYLKYYHASASVVSTTIPFGQPFGQPSGKPSGQPRANLMVSFDFDSTLQRPEVQRIAKQLIKGGCTVYIVTSRSESATANVDLFEVAVNVGIPKHRIVFTEYEDKAEFLAGFDMHFDDDPHEIEMIMSANNGCIGVLLPITINSNFQLP